MGPYDERYETGALTELHYEDERRKAGVHLANGVEERLTLVLRLGILERVLA